VEQPKVEQPKPDPVTQTPKFVAPVEVPDKTPEPEQTADIGQGAGVPGGVAGGVPEGVPGGVEGGVKGGVEGGVVGGVEGGVKGGEVGGVEGGVPKEDPEPPAGPVRVGGQIHPPRKLKNVDPVYSDLARQARVSGVVILEATISKDGRVTDVKILRGAPLLQDAAVDAVKQWVYSPTLLNGEPVAVIMTVTVNFRVS
jgi:protein TonB